MSNPLPTILCCILLSRIRPKQQENWFNSGLTSGKWSSNLIQLRKKMRFYFHLKKSTPNHRQLFFNGTQVTKVNQEKHLGLILENDLSFEKHLEEKFRKAKKNIGIVKHLSKSIPLKTLDEMYKALAHSHLDYCDLIYHIPLTLSLHNLMEKVERIQYQAAPAITGAWHGSNRLKYMKNFVRKLYLIVVWINVFYKFTKLLMVKLLLIL